HDAAVVRETGYKGTAVVQRVVVDLHGPAADRAGVGDVCHVDAAVVAGFAVPGRRPDAHVVDHVVVGLDFALRRIHGGEIDSVARIIVNQVVVDGKIKLVVTRGIAGPSAVQRRGVKLYGPAAAVVMNVIPAYVHVVGVSGKVNRMLLLAGLYNS